MESRDDSCQTKSAQNEAETEMVHIGHKSCSDVEARVIFGAKGDDAAYGRWSRVHAMSLQEHRWNRSRMHRNLQKTFEAEVSNSKIGRRQCGWR